MVVMMMMALLVFSTGGLAPSNHDLPCREVPTSGVGHDATNLIRVGGQDSSWKGAEGTRRWRPVFTRSKDNSALHCTARELAVVIINQV